MSTEGTAACEHGFLPDPAGLSGCPTCNQPPVAEGLDPERVYDLMLDVAQREEQEPELYYGPPDRDRCCAYTYKPGLRCPEHIDFYVKIPDGRGSDWRKARAACLEHLPDVIWQMQKDHGQYRGEYLLRAADL